MSTFFIFIYPDYQKIQKHWVYLYDITDFPSCNILMWNEYSFKHFINCQTQWFWTSTPVVPPHMTIPTLKIPILDNFHYSQFPLGCTIDNSKLSDGESFLRGLSSWVEAVQWKLSWWELSEQEFSLGNYQGGNFSKECCPVRNNIISTCSLYQLRKISWCYEPFMFCN